MKKFIIFAAVICSALSANSQVATEIDGIYYFLDEETRTASVTYKNDVSYTGDIVIPATVNYGDDWDYTVTVIDESAFNNQKITSVSLPNTIEEIRANAFYDCKSLTSLTIPESVKSIGSFIINGTGITELTVLATTLPVVSEKSFKKYLKIETITLYVPTGTEKAYSADANWNCFKEIKTIEAEETPTENPEENPSTAISAATNVVSVSVQGKNLVVTNAKNVVVYNIMGEVVATGSFNKIQPSGVYLVVADGKSFKVFVR
ncbi:MAG: leucine-rich repeat domain-containing protein [Bacteroidales bacterium]|nr:leucine-rich repeat domain-containing protein [Bacteroidales bacterium]